MAGTEPWFIPSSFDRRTGALHARARFAAAVFVSHATSQHGKI
jgi:hypothetical protein